MDGTAGDENPRTRPIQKYASDTHIDKIPCNEKTFFKINFA